MDTITVRHMRFELADELDPVIIEGEPEESYAMVALSLLLPYLEPYLIRTMRAARSQVSDPALLADLDKFVAQEGQHYRQHMAFNARVRNAPSGGGPLGEVRRLEEELDADYRRFTKEKPLRWNLAYAEGFEAFTTAMARVFVDADKSRWNPAVLDLYLWHLVEELEHRTVAFDVYERIVGGYAHRLAVGAFAQWHLFRFMMRAAEAMLAADPRTLSIYGGAAGRRAREPRLQEILFRKLLPKVIGTWSPWYTPHDIAMPEAIRELAIRYTESAIRAVP